MSRVRETKFTAADGRVVDTRIFLPPADGETGPLIVFSHGSFSSNRLYDALLEPWAQAGYVVAAPTHVDSESNPDRGRYDRQAVFDTRLADLRLMLDEVPALIAHDDPALATRLEKRPAVVAGHSLGALIAQITAGAAALDRHSGAPGSERQRRLAGIVAISPPGPVAGIVSAEVWTNLTLPMVVTTGTADQVPNFAPDWHLHLASFEQSPPHDKFAVVADGADHYFGGVICRPTVPGPRRDDLLVATNEVILAFLDAFARADAAALARLRKDVAASESSLVKVTMR